MQELTKVFNGQPLRIEMIDEDKMEFWVDISGITKEHGKFIKDYEKRDRFKEMLKYGEKSVSDVLLKSGHSVKIHSSILINFASWLSIEFEVWANDFVFSYLTGKFEAEKNGLTSKVKEIENKYSEQISDLKCKINEKTQHKLVTYRDDTQSLRKWIQDKFPEYAISEKELWEFLENHHDKILRDETIRRYKKILLHEGLGKQVGDSIAFNEEVLSYIQEFVGEANLTKKPQQGKFEF